MESLAFSVVILLALVAFSNYSRGTLGDWLKAKFLNAGEPTRIPARAAGGAGGGGGAGSSRNGARISCPVPGAQVLSVWGDPRDGGARRHEGIDLGAPTGTAIGAVLAGRVLRAGDAGNCGLRVAISHAGGLESIYCHLSHVSVRAGQQVREGQTVGKVGNTGNAASTAPHLHFEIHEGGGPRDPAGYLPAGCGGNPGNAAGPARPRQRPQRPTRQQDR